MVLTSRFPLELVSVVIRMLCKLNLVVLWALPLLQLSRALPNDLIPQFECGDYLCSGQVDLTQWIEFPTSHYFHICNNYLEDVSTKSSRVTLGRDFTVFQGTQLELMVTFKWVMQGGEPLSYGECEVAIGSVEHVIQHDAHLGYLNQHPIIISVSDANGNVKMILSVEKQQGTDVQITTPAPNPLSFRGVFYPDKRLARGDILDVLGKAERDAIQYAQFNPTVPKLTTSEETSGTVSTGYHFEPNLPIYEPWPQFSYNDLAALYVAIRNWYQNNRQWCILGGEISFSPGESVQFLPIGTFGLENSDGQPLQRSDDTAPVVSFSPENGPITA